MKKDRIFTVFHICQSIGLFVLLFPFSEFLLCRLEKPSNMYLDVGLVGVMLAWAFDYLNFSCLIRKIHDKKKLVYIISKVNVALIVVYFLWRYCLLKDII